MENNKNKSWNNDKVYLSIIKDLISNKKVLQMKNITHHHYSDRLEHSILVSYKSYLIARKLGLDFVSVARGGLLHDFFLLDRKEVSKLELGSHSSVHPKLALENAMKITKINDIEKDIILKHMFGATVKPPKYKESYLVSMVDKYVAMADVFNPLGRKLKYKALTTLITSTMILSSL